MLQTAHSYKLKHCYHSFSASPGYMYRFQEGLPGGSDCTGVHILRDSRHGYLQLCESYY